MRRDFNHIPAFIIALRRELSDNLEDAARDTHNKMVRNWEQGMDARGRAWEPISSETAARKGNADILIDTGEMIDSAGYTVDKKNMTASVHVDDPKIVYHEYGTERIPARPVLSPAAHVLAQEAEGETARAVDEAAAKAATTGAGLSVLTKALGR